jgi:hypothetical protein
MNAIEASKFAIGAAVVSVTVVSSVASIVSKGVTYDGRKGKSSVSL